MQGHTHIQVQSSANKVTTDGAKKLQVLLILATGQEPTGTQDPIIDATLNRLISRLADHNPDVIGCHF